MWRLGALAALTLVIAICCWDEPLAVDADAQAKDASDPIADVEPKTDALAALGLEVVFTRDELGARPRALHLDETHLYWAQQGYVRRARKDTKSIETLGSWGGDLTLDLIHTDDAHVYWINRGRLQKARKDGSRTVELDTPEDIVIEALTIDDGHVYFADVLCSQIGRINKDGTELRIATRELEPTERIGGAVRMVVDADYAYCTNQQRIFRTNADITAVEIAASSDESVSSITQAGDKLYWTGQPYGIAGLHNINQFQKPDGPITRLVVGPHGSPPMLHFDNTRRQFFYISPGSATFGKVVSYRLGDATFEELATDRHTHGGVAGDETHIYWSEHAAIMRMKKPAPQ